MSSTGTTGFNWTALGSDLAAVGSAIATFFPSASAAISVASTIVQGVVDEVPEAVALYKQITGGTPVTAAQLASYSSAYEQAYATLNADIAAALTKAS